MEIVPGPDFPTGGFICGRNGIRAAYESGRGAILMRGRTSFEEHPKTGRKSIVATEIPYQVNKARLIEKIAELVRDKRIEGISDIRDESDREGMRIVVDLKKDAVPEVVQNNLWKMTPLQESFGINMLAIVEGRPQILSLKQALHPLRRRTAATWSPGARSSISRRPATGCTSSRGSRSPSTTSTRSSTSSASRRTPRRPGWASCRASTCRPDRPRRSWTCGSPS